MSDKQPLDIPNGYYYARLQDNGHRPLFASKGDFKGFYTSLQQWHEQTHAYVVAYCLFEHDAHLLIKVSDRGVVADIRTLIECYTHWHNEHYQRNGSLFNSRFHYTLIDDRHYLLPAVQKIHRLPILLKLVPDTSIYPWNSHAIYLQEKPCPAWLDKHDAMGRIALQRQHTRRRYEDFMALSQPNVRLTDGNHSRYLALIGKDYLQREKKKRQAQPELPTPSLEDLIEVICQERGLVRSDLSVRQHFRRANEAKAIIAYMAKEYESELPNTVAAHLDIDADLLQGQIATLKHQKMPYLLNLKQQLDRRIRKIAKAQRTRAGVSASPALEEDPSRTAAFSS